MSLLHMPLPLCRCTSKCTGFVQLRLCTLTVILPAAAYAQVLCTLMYNPLYIYMYIYFYFILDPNSIEFNST